jgi:hypothetical protein
LRQPRDVRNSVQALLRRRRAKLSQTNLTHRARALSTALSTRAPFSARVRQREQIRIGLNAIEALYQLS